MSWWVLWTGWSDGAWNMAADEWLMSTADRRPPTLRIYGWRYPTISLGRNERWQRVVRLEGLAGSGAHLVRRPTGGRAVLHHRELTYSVTASRAAEGELGGRLEDSLSKISEALAVSLRSLGTDVETVRRDSPVGRQEGYCFETATRFELVTAGRKLVGSAQYRTSDAFLQHGSLPLYPTLSDLSRLGPRPAATAPEPSSPLPAQTHMALDQLGVRVAEGFARSFRSPVVHKALGLLDQTAISRFCAGRYLRPEWTFRR